MKRQRSIAVATLLIVGTGLFFVQNQDKLLEAYQSRKTHESTSVGSPGSSHIQEPIGLDDGLSVNTPPISELDPPSGFPLEIPTSQSTTPSPEELPSQAFPPALNELPPADTPGLGAAAPDIPPPASPSSAIPENGIPDFQPEFPFQRDLQLDLPIETFKQFSGFAPHNYKPVGQKTNVYATFMATRNPSVKDPYYMAIHSLIYRILWSPRSRTEKYPFVVFVGDFVTAEQRQLLSGAGAIVRELAPLEWNPIVPGIQHRWKDLFAKLNMWNETEFDRILFLDADAFPVENIDSMFDISNMQNCIGAKLQPDDHLLDGSEVCEPYVFAGVPQDPNNNTDVNINVGAMVFNPSERMHQRLLQNYVKTDRYNCLMAEQAFLNWQFNINGAFPSTSLERKWGGAFPDENDEGKLKVVHEKLWADDRRWLKEEWHTQWQEMMLFYNGTDFAEKRTNDGMNLVRL